MPPPAAANLEAKQREMEELKRKIEQAEEEKNRKEVCYQVHCLATASLT